MRRFNRRDFLKGAATCGLAAAGLSLLEGMDPLGIIGKASAASAKPRQVIFVTLDTTRADHIGAYGNKVVKTPNLDKLAERSVLFESCFSVANQTSPSHTSIFTSLYQKDHGVYTNKTKMPDDPRVMARLFKAAGFSTAAFTSVDHLSIADNFNQGFDYFDNGNQPSRKAYETNAGAFKWLDGNYKKDLFLWVHYFDAHLPYAPPEPYNRMYSYKSNQRIDFRVKIASEFKEKWLKELYDQYFAQSQDPEYYRDLYEGGISYQDSQFGLLIKKLQDIGIYENCYIVVVADHGESLGEHGQYWCHEDLYDINIHVPLIIKLKGEVFHGRRRQLVSTIDIYPTLFSLMNIRIRDSIRGENLLNIIKDARHPEIRRKVYYQYGDNWYLGIKDRDYTNILLLDRGKKLSDKIIVKHELYDNRKDKEQMHDISNGRNHSLLDKEVLNFLKDRIKVKPPQTITDKESLERLKSLGYLQ